jgi:glycosyltransferase involved in cell wall biosynthesis
MTTPPVVSVIIPIRNEARSIGLCLESVLGQDYPRDRLEVLVAEGMSQDGTRAILEEFRARDGRVRVIDNPRGIVSTGLNAALRAARGEVIVRMDAHTDYAPDYVRACVTVLKETGADNVGGPARTRAQTYRERAIAAAYHSRFSCGGARFHDVDYEGLVDTVTYGCWKKETFETPVVARSQTVPQRGVRVGLFDEELVRNQDDEHNLRLCRAGGKVWQSPRIRSWYRPRGSLTGLFRQYMQYGYWKVRVIRKHRSPASLRHVAPALFVATVILLSVTSIFWAPARWPLAGLVGAYLVGTLAASTVAARRWGPSLLPVLPAVFWCYHLGYGYGFLRGLWDFVVRGAAVPHPSFTTVTRTVSASECTGEMSLRHQDSPA